MQDAIRTAAEAEIARLLPFAGGDTGVAALHLQSGARLGVGEHGRYPPGSSIKMAIVLAIFDLLDKGALTLEQMVEVQDAEMTYSGPIGGEFAFPGVALSVLNLLEVMLTRSDNTATDVLLRLTGGTRGVQAYLRREGIDDFDITLTMREALCVMHEVPLPPSDVSIRDWMRQQPPEVMDARERPHATGFDYQLGVRDHCTPLAMVELLRRLYLADRVTPRARQIVLPIMMRAMTSPRIVARLPAGVRAGTKTGSGSGTCSDAGYIVLPGAKGTLALSIQVKASPESMATREAVVADVARLIYDTYVLTTPDEFPS